MVSAHMQLAATLATLFASGVLAVPAPQYEEDNCSTRTVCIDKINSCGQKYGSCFPDCHPWPTVTPPPCSSVTSTYPTVSIITEPPTVTDCSSRTICVDSINSCGMTYGGCFADCGTTPSFAVPSCPTGTGYTPSPITTTTSTTGYSSSSSSSSSSSGSCSDRTVCADYVNDCGQWYGGCFPDCTPWPTFTAPPCTKTSSTTSTYSISTYPTITSTTTTTSTSRYSSYPASY